MDGIENSIPYFGETIALLTALAWAVAVIFFKKSGETVHPLALNLFKNLLAFILFIPTIYLSGGTLFYSAPPEYYWLLLISGLLGIGIGDTLFLKSLNILGAGFYSIVGCLYSPSIIVLSFFWLGESMTLFQLIGAGLIISAVLTAASKKGMGNLSRRDLFLGITWAVISHLVSAVGIVMIKQLLEQSPILWVTEIRLFSGIVFLAAVVLLRKNRREIIFSLNRAKSWGYTISGSFVGAYLAMILWLAGMKYTQASIAAALNQTANIFVFILAVILLKETINLQRIVGILLAITGAILVTFG
ncbi:MAG: DMT family transporter [Candidatus Zixiibacteriota bacterium]